MRGLLVKSAVATALLLSSALALSQARVTRPQVPLPEGPLRNVILKNCVSCHGIDDYAFHALSRERWQDLLRDRHVNYPVKAIPATDEALLLDYLAKNFGPEGTPFPRKYIPPELDSFYDDEQGRQQLDVVCTECHELDRVYETRGSLDRWRVLLLEMRARGAHLPNDPDMERLAEWLSRVQKANLFE